MKHGKRYVEAAKAVDRATLYDAADAIALVKKTAVAKFDETIEAHIRTGCDGRHADQQIRGAVVLPHGTGKVTRILVFAKGAKADEAQAAAKVKSLITEMSHDLRTPLTTLLLYTEILRHHKYETEAQQDEYLAKIDGKARQIKQLSDNLFEYALVTRDTVVQLDASARFSQIFEEPLAEMVEMLQQRGFACALELGSEDVLLTVRAQYIRRILDNIGSNLIKYADPARPIEVQFLRQEGRAGLVFRNHVLPAPPAVESTKVGLTSIETMMDKMHADCKIEQENEQFTMTLLFPISQ